jgi:hypothetical protein
MKTKHFLKPFGTIVFLLLISSIILFESCNKDDDPEDEPTWVLNGNYEGELLVEFINTTPPWNESTTMDVQVAGLDGKITITAATLNYSGDSVNITTKIERSGQWNITPTATLVKQGTTFNIEVDAQTVVQNDIQSTYTKDMDGNWVLESEDTFDEAPNPDLVFSLEDAANSSSVVEETLSTGMVRWTLTLPNASMP